MRLVHRIHGRVHGLVLAFALVLVCQTGESRADNESDRRQYLSDIDSKLSSAAGELSGFETASSASDLDDARSYVRDVASLVSRLDGVKDDDSTAKDVAYRYPRFIDDWNAAAGYLRQLKDKQPLAIGYLKSCTAWDTAMRERAKSSKDDPRAAEELSSFAKSVGRQGQDLMSEASRMRDQMEDYAEEVADFSADMNNWTRLRDATRYAGSGIWRRWDKDYEEAKRACEEVVKGERHREVEATLGKLANSKSGRAELRTKLDSMLAVIADRVYGAAGHSDASNINGGLQVTREIASLLERLKAAQGDDDETRKIASEWPGWNEELRVAIEGLITMKQKQNGADAGEEKCKAAERELQELIKTVLSTPARHRGGVAEIEKVAIQLGNDWKPRLAAAAEGDRELNQGYEKAKRFSRSDAPWGTIRDRLHASADAIRSHWNDKYAAAKKQCEPLALGVDNPDVRAARDQLGRNTSSTQERSRAFYAELKLWEGEISTLRDWTAKDVEEIRAAFCRAPDAGEYEEAIAVADRWATQLNSQYGTIMGRGEQLKQAADALIAKGRSKDRMEKVKQRITDAIASITKIKEEQLAGSNNPLFKAQASYGVSKHESMQGSCNAKEITIRDYCKNPHPKRKDCRLDCMKGCTVIEIKPKSQRDLGGYQADAYVDGLEKMFAAKGMDMFKQDRMGYFEQCLNSDKTKLVLTRDVETYDFCEGMTAEKLVEPVPTFAADADSDD